MSANTGSNKRRPDFDVSAMDKSTSYKGKVGAAWANEDGSISVVLNPFVVLAANERLVITLFKREPYE